MNNIAVSITADVADLQAKRAIMSAELKQATKDLNEFARSAKDSGTKQISSDMLAAADAVAKHKAQIKSIDGELKSTSHSTEALNFATSQSTREFIVLGHEAMRGNFSRIPGSMIVLAERTGGLHAALAALTPAAIGVGAAVATVVGVSVAAAVATNQYEKSQRQLISTALGTAAASGLSAQQIEAAGVAAEGWSGMSRSASIAAAEAFASAGVRSQQSVQSLTASVQTFADLTGQKAADAQKELAAAMEDPIKGAQDLNDKLGILDATQMEQIRIAAESGDKNKALAILLKAYTDRVVDAQSAGVGLAGNWDTLKQKAQDLWAWLGKVNEQLEIYQTFGLNAPGIEQQLSDQQKAAERRIQFVVPLLMQSAAGMAAVGETPEGQDRAAKEHLTTTIALLQKAIAADRKLNDSEGLKQATAALQDYRRALDTWIPSAEKAHRVASLDAQISEARRKHNKELVDSLTQQRETLQTAGQVMSPSEAAQRAADAGEKGGASVGAGRHGAKGPSVVQEWAEQLHQQEIASNDFFGDQTQKELEFWQGKVGQVKAGSKEALEVQAHVYDAAKALARQDYQDHLADLNAKIEADRDSWSREKSDWDEKLAFIKSKFGEESAEYKNAARDFAAVERQHQDETLRIQEEAGRQQLEALRSHLAAMRQARQELESVSEAVASSGGGSGLLGEVKAAVQVGAMRHQMFVEEMGDAATAHAKEVQFADEKVARLKAAGKEEEKDYQKALDDRLALDQKYADERMQLEAQMRADSIRNILAVQQAYHGYIDGVVGSTVSGFTGMLSDTMTWAQAVRGVYGSLVNVVDQVLSRMLTNWIVTHVLMTAEQRAQIAAQTAIQVAGEGAKVAATVVGSQAQVAATAVGTAEKGAIVGVSNLKEITSHAAAGAAAAYHAMAGIPVVGPVLGAVAAAATFAAIEGFGSMAAFEKGIDMVPQNMPAYLHSGERVFPAADNRKIIAAVERGSGGGGGRNGDVNMTNNFHLAPGTPKSFSQQLQDHASDLKAMVKRMHRDGSFS